MAGEATRKFRDDTGLINPGFVRASFSASGASSGNLADLSKFNKLIYELYCEGTQYANVTLSLYSISTSASSISSASSNWTQVDSTNCLVSLASSAASLSSGQFAMVLDTRAEKFMQASQGTRYVRPVITCGSGVSSSSVANLFLACKGQLAAYGPASGQETPAYTIVSEVDYL